MNTLNERGEYVEKHLKAVRERQAIELERAVEFFGEEWDKEHSDG